MADKYKATLHGIPLEIQDINDEFSKAIAKYEFPYRDGALLEDMGQKARTIKFRCYFYEESYEWHKSVITLLDYQGEVELMHPKYGMVKGSIESVSIRHDDREQTAEIDINFVEKLIGLEPDAQAHIEIESAVEACFVTGQAEQMDEYCADVTGELGVEAGTILSKVLDPAQSVLSQFTAISLTARNYLKQVDTYIATCRATLSVITNPANSLISTIEYGVNLPGLVIGSIAQAVERYAILYESLKTAPVRFCGSLRTSFALLEAASGPFEKNTKIACSQRLAIELGYIYKSDESYRSQLKRSEKLKSFDALGNYVGSGSASAIMTINEIEQTLAAARTDLQAAVNVSRGLQSLKDMARDLLEHVNKIKIEREKILTVEEDISIPLHLLCLKHGLPYNYAERVHAINNIRHPNFTQGNVRIYAR